MENLTITLTVFKLYCKLHSVLNMEKFFEKSFDSWIEFEEEFNEWCDTYYQPVCVRTCLLIKEEELKKKFKYDYVQYSNY